MKVDISNLICTGKNVTTSVAMILDYKKFHLFKERGKSRRLYRIMERPKAEREVKDNFRETVPDSPSLYDSAIMSALGIF